MIKKFLKKFIFVSDFKSIITRDSNLFDFRQSDPAPVLLIVDRREDPVTPLLNQVKIIYA
jgi:vacuolar protein sorting-associated protein 45